MGLEAVTHISDLVVTNPIAADPKSEGDDHIRNIKVALKTDFPNINGPVSATDEELSGLAAASIADVSGTITPSALWAMNAASSGARKLTKNLAVLQLSFTSSGAASPVSIGTLPVAFWPPEPLEFVGLFYDASAGTYVGVRVYVLTNGVFGGNNWPVAVATGDILAFNCAYYL